MDSIKNETLKNATFTIGLGLIALSVGIFMLPELFNFGKFNDSNFGVFILNYLISIVYFIIIYIREIPKIRLEHFYEKIEYGFIHLILCLISAYSLNREIPVFEQSTTWLQVFLVAQSVLLLIAFIKDHLQKWMQFIFWSFLGIDLIFFIYLSIFLLPIYPVSIIVSPAFGFSLHAFVPIWFVLTILLYLFRNDNRNTRNIQGFSLGIIVTIVFVSLFLVKWNNTNKIITRAVEKSILDEKSELPEWTVIAKNLPKNAVSEKLLKTGLVYMTAENGNWELFNFPDKNFDEVKKHDPLIVTATYLFGKPAITDEQKIKILESMYDSRHNAQERLWSGDDLQTQHVITNARIYPNLHIAYTEKFITIRNMRSKKSWRQQQEAIYTFHLPEGGVVTSLSLWINRKEEKAVLTSKHKADTAYRTIVGVESHDPSLVRWQEGNTVSVRIFPCTPDEDRRFKIGITAPLKKENNNLVYENIWFDGPKFTNADETVKILAMDDINNLIIPKGYKPVSSNTWSYEGNYNANWMLKFSFVPVKPNKFCFAGNSYSISEYKKKYSSFNPENIYLDINREWSFKELQQVLQILNAKKVFVYNNKLVKINNENAEQLYDFLVKENFSVFPFYEIKNPENSLIISKGTSISPNISDLGESEFAARLKDYALNHQGIKLFNIGQELSPYIKTLKELRLFDYDFGTLNDLSAIIRNNYFIENQEDKNKVVIDNAGIKISSIADSDTISNAPDHLMRLFAYNSTLMNTGTHYFEKDYFNPDIVDNAYKAYVVSPVTSLIVLESSNDYKRFGINDSGTSLKNASMKSSGAVPEPHEWLLIIVLVGVAGYLFYQKRKNIAL